jgi:hypothetical protein
MKKIKNVKMNLTISPEFYQVLQENAQSDYVKVATWTGKASGPDHIWTE